MSAVERRRYITKLLRRDGLVRVKDLAEALNVTAVTIRSDLEYLERRGRAVRTHGGAVMPEKEELARPISSTLHENADKKHTVAQLAVDLITPESTIIVDAGSTTAILSQYLRDFSLTVVTNSVPVIGELLNAENISVIVSGGAIRKPAKAMVGELARWAYQSIHADIAFIGASGVSLEHGVSSASLLEADGKREMIRAAGTVCLVADSTKMGHLRFAKICDWDKVDYFITDDAPEEIILELEARGVSVITPSHRPTKLFHHRPVTDRE